MPQSLYEWIWVFLIYAFLGWAVEEVFHAVRQGKFVNRGFLNGPWCPIYGFGMLLVIALLYPLKSNLIILFLGSFVLLTLLEFLTGFVLNHFFHSRWWDYSDKPLQFGGYVCLQFSICWGVAGTVVIELIHDPIYWCVTHFPELPGFVIECVVSAVFLTDCGLTLFSILKLTGKVKALDDLSKSLRHISDEIGENLYQNTETVAGVLSDAEVVIKESSEEKKMVRVEKKKVRQQRLDALRTWAGSHRQETEDLKAQYDKASAKRVFGERRLLKAFPNVKFTNLDEALQKYKKHVTES